MKLVALAVLAFASVASAAQMVTVTEAPELTPLWRVGSAADPNHVVNLNFALHRRNMDTLTGVAAAVSNPQSPLYTEYPSHEELIDMTAATEEAITTVTAWLRENDVEYTVAATRSTIAVDLPVSKASALLSTSFTNVHHSTTGQNAVIGKGATVPVEVAAHIETVFGVHGLPLPPRKKVASPSVVDVTPSVINSAYSISGVNATRGMANRQGVAEFQGQLMSSADLKTFFGDYVKDALPGDDKVYKFVGDQSQGEGVEANLDVQYIMGTALGVKTEMWQYAGQDFCTDLKQWTQQIISTSNPPNLFSVSYGWQGDMTQIGCSTSQISSIDDDFKTITASGVSIIFASGDSGSACSGGFFGSTKCYASWPASSIYVTAVGATTFTGAAGSEEMATTQFGSGGGFSRIITPAPSFQTAAIASFNSKETAFPPAKDYGKGGRGTPDVAALGEGFQVIMNGSPESVGGTSAAAPTFAGVVSLLNEARIQKGKKAMGNMNAFIYQNADCFTDITKGNDRVSRSGSAMQYGFDCEEGWDPVTGFGTPNFPKLLKAALAA